MTFEFLTILKNALRIHSYSKVSYDQNFSTSWYKKNLTTFKHIKEGKTYILHKNCAEKVLRDDMGL